MPGLHRTHEIQRSISYGSGVIAGLVLDLGPVRRAGLITGSLLLLLALSARVVRPPTSSPFVLALVDILVAPTLVGFATATPSLAVVSAVVLGVIVFASYATSPWLLVAVVLVSGTGGFTAAALTRTSESASSPSVAALALVALLLVIALVILIYFGRQSLRLRESLSTRELELAQVLDATPITLISVSPGGRLQAAGSASQAFIEATPMVNDLVGRTRAEGRIEERVTLQGRVFAVTSSAGPEGTTLVAYDVTELEQSKRRLEDLVRDKDQFVAAISHELRTPLTAVLGFAEELRASPPSELSPLYDVVADQSQEMAAIIEDLLVGARTDLGTITVLRQPVELAAATAEVLAALDHRLRRSVDLRLDPAPSFGDPVRVRQILRNLLTNADRYGGHEVMVRTGIEGDRAFAEVLDSGDPIPLEFRNRIFEPYESTGTRRGQPAAIGLGLAVSRRLADLMDGSLTYHHDDTWGIFKLQLPIGRPSAS
jgi:signal transduction histidine kinase